MSLALDDEASGDQHQANEEVAPANADLTVHVENDHEGGDQQQESPELNYPHWTGLGRAIAVPATRRLRASSERRRSCRETISDWMARNE